MQQSQLTPDNIRAIRKRLGLTQEQAGRLLGGGPRAFTRYENGTLKPRTSALNLLRVLDEFPQALLVLGADDVRTTNSVSFSPFEVEADTIASLNSDVFTKLVKRLLYAESKVHKLSEAEIHVASNINAPDGGEDGRISWEAGAERTRFLPSRFCQFQMKAAKISPADAAKDVLSEDGNVKEMIRSVLEQRGNYIMVCTHQYNQQMIEARQRRILKTLSEAGLAVTDQQIIFRGGDQIADWVNAYPTVALWVKEQAGLGTLGGFNTWDHWRSRSEHNVVPWAKDPRLDALCLSFQEIVTKPKKILRLIGSSGVGKSRLCLEALGRLGRNNFTGRLLRDSVMYAAQPELNLGVIIDVIDKLARFGGPAIVVVDNCDAKTHQTLVSMVLRKDSQLSLITIDCEIPAHLSAEAILIDEAPETVMESIVAGFTGELSSVDRYRLMTLSRGFPLFAIQIAKEIQTAREYGTEPQFVYPAEDRLIEEFVCGRNSTDRELMLKSAQLIAALGSIRIETAEANYSGNQMGVTAEEYLCGVAKLGRGMTWEDLYVGIQKLIQRNVAKRRGGLVTIEPRPIAIRLALLQWIEWSPQKWYMVLSGDVCTNLSTSAAERLAELNTMEVAHKVVEYISQEDGVFSNQGDHIISPRGVSVVSALAEIKPDVVAELIERSLDRLDDICRLDRSIQSSLVQALSKIAFHSETFKIGARLLLRLTGIEPEFLKTGASDSFTKLFTPAVGRTEADGSARLQFIDEVAQINAPAQLDFIVDALMEGCMIGKHSRDSWP